MVQFCILITIDDNYALTTQAEYVADNEKLYPSLKDLPTAC